MSSEVLLRFPEHTSDEDVAVTVVVVLAIRRAIEGREQSSIDDEWRFSLHPGFQPDWRHSLN